MLLYALQSQSNPQSAAVGIYSEYKATMLISSVIAVLVPAALGFALLPSSYETLHPPINTEQDQVPLDEVIRTPRPFPYGRLINEKTSLTFLCQNSLDNADDKNHVGAVLLDPMRQHELRDACEDIGETLLPLSALKEDKEDFSRLFSYVLFTRNHTTGNDHAEFYFRQGVLSVSNDGVDLYQHAFPTQDIPLPVLCTQKGLGSKVGAKTYVQRQAIRVYSEGNLYIGSQDRKSFRFLGIPYADPPTRFTYAKPFSGRFRTIHAMDYGSKCSQVGGGSEDCLYLNIQTPYIPRRNSSNDLRPVLFWIHSGDFTTGSGSDPMTDGANLASREGIVVVTFNYRLSTLGFLAVPETEIRGNYGIADQILALEVAYSCPFKVTRLTYAVDNQKYRSIRWRSWSNYYRRRRGRGPFRESTTGLASCLGQVPRRYCHVSLWR